MAAPSLKGLFGGGGKPPPADEPDGDEPTSGDKGDKGDEYPPEYTAAYEEYADNPSAETFWRAVEACTESKGGGGLAILLGGKGKK